MDRANKAMRQKFKKVQQNLGLSEKRDELLPVQHVDIRNQKIISSVVTYRKNVANCIKTNAKDEEKRKKKLDEYSLMVDLTNESRDMDMSSCLGKVMKIMGTTVSKALDERIHLEQNLEKRIVEPLAKYIDMDKALAKSKEKLANLSIDVDIARKAMNNAKSGEEQRNQDLQEQFDMTESRLDIHKDATITDIFALAAKEQEISSIFAAYIEEQIEYHRSVLLAYENALPEILREIATAQPRPVFGVDLEEHLRHSNRRISPVIECCCSMIKQYGFEEKGLFRVNGNNTRIRRMKAAFDAGQIELERDDYISDPHSVCSVLKSYLRELPEPLLTSYLFNEWQAVTKLEGMHQLEALQRLLNRLPSANRENLTYLINFLSEMLLYEHVTMMNASNLSIVFGPNLVCGGTIENENVIGSKIVELLLIHANQLFGVAHNVSLATTNTTYPSTLLGVSPTGSSSFSSGTSSSLLIQPCSSPAEEHPPTIDTSIITKRSNPAPSPASSVSPGLGRSGSLRPKQPAPQPPSNSGSLSLIRAEMDVSSRSQNSTYRESSQLVREKQPYSEHPINIERVSACFQAPLPDKPQRVSDGYGNSSSTEYDNVPNQYIAELGDLDQLVEQSHKKQSGSHGSTDSMNEYATDCTWKNELKPLRPPLPAARTFSGPPVRTSSYHSTGKPSKSNHCDQHASTRGRFPIVDVSASAKKEDGAVVAHRPPIVHDAENRTLITVENHAPHQSLATPSSTTTTSASNRATTGIKPPLPVKPKQEEITKL